MTQQACQWRQTNDPYMPDTWEADCGAMWTFTDGGPKDNHMRFCPQCGHPLQQIDNAMNHKSDPYASEAETQALMVPDTLMKAERKLAKMMAERGADEQGAEAYLILRQIAVELLAEQPAQQITEAQVEAALKAAHMHSTPESRKDMRRAIEATAPQPAQQEPVADRAFLGRVLAAMEGVVDAADRKTVEFDALRSCIVDLTLMLHSPQPVQPQQEPVAWVRWEWNRSGLRSLTFSKPAELPLAEEATGVVYDPLYTSPPARKPLTRQQVKEMMVENGYDQASPQERADFINGLRMVKPPTASRRTHERYAMPIL